MARGRERKTTVGWTVPVGALGLLVSLAGWLEYRATELPHLMCGLSRDLAKVSSTLSSSSHVVNLSPCVGVDRRYVVALTALYVGAGLALVAFVVGWLRARAAAATGEPWLVHRVFRRLVSATSHGVDALAGCIDRALPGQSKSGRPRVSPALLSPLLLVLTSYGVFNAHHAWAAHERRVHARELAAAETALAGMRLPAGVTPYAGMGCAASPDQRCVYSDMRPADVTSTVETMIDGHVRSASTGLDLVCAPFGLPPGESCPITVEGRVNGYRAVAVITQHDIFPRLGQKVPPGAVPTHPGSHIFVLGSVVFLGLVHD